MRMRKGEPFLDIRCEYHIPDPRDIEEMHYDNIEAHREGYSIPVFSEVFLYPRLGKEDARFVLGVAEEYARLIEVLGPEEVKRLLEGRD